MLEALKKIIGIKTIEVSVIEMKTVEGVVKVFTAVMDDLQEIQDNALNEIAEFTIDIAEIKKTAELRVVKCQEAIDGYVKESDRAKAIIGKISGLLA